METDMLFLEVMNLDADWVRLYPNAWRPRRFNVATPGVFDVKDSETTWLDKRQLTTKKWNKGRSGGEKYIFWNLDVRKVMKSASTKKQCGEKILRFLPFFVVFFNDFWTIVFSTLFHVTHASSGLVLGPLVGISGVGWFVVEALARARGGETCTGWKKNKTIKIIK